jgi:hypothetical protein
MDRPKNIESYRRRPEAQRSETFAADVEMPSGIGSANPENEPDLGFRHADHGREIRLLQLEVRVFVETAFVFGLHRCNLEGFEKALEYRSVLLQTVAKCPQVSNTQQRASFLAAATERLGRLRIACAM